MSTIPLERVPQPARSAWTELRDGLRAILGDDLVALWASGGTVAPDGPAHAGDLDTHAILARRPGADIVGQIEAAHSTIGAAHEVEWDAWYLLAEDARRTEAPPHAWHEGRRDTTWAVNRAHWLAGRYVILHGADAEELVVRPTWPELEAELDRELEHIERHVVEGDTDPFEATYAFLNGSRILRSLATRDVVGSKHAAGTWALEHLPSRWHGAIGAAMRTYTGDGTPTDADRLAAEMSPFVGFVRRHLPPATDRPPGAAPRWSGS